MIRVLVTGSTGFIGRRVCDCLEKECNVVKVCRTQSVASKNDNSLLLIRDIAEFDLSVPVDVVVHLAARVHVLKETSSNPIGEYRRVNTLATLRLAKQAARIGVKRFIFLSSIGVNGNSSGSIPFSETECPSPHNPYAISKLEAEQGLLEIARQTGMEVVIIRPPLVYGPGVKANFLKMMEWLYRCVPLPLGAINNRRSLVAIDNLVDFIVTCIHHPAAANQVFLAADGEDLSTTKLLKKLAYCLGKPARLIPVPKALLEAGLKMAGKADLAIRLCGSLQVDISKAKENLGWRPPVTVDEGLRQTAIWFLQAKGH